MSELTEQEKELGYSLAGLVKYPLVKWHIVGALFWLGLALAAGMLYALALVGWDVLPDVEGLSRGRIRMIHTNMVAFGFLTNAFLAMLNWTVPRLTGREVASKLLGYVILIAWNVIMLAVAGLLAHGYAQGVEWGETPVVTDWMIIFAAVLVSVQFYTPIIRSREKSMYVTLWYFSAAFVWLALTYIMGNVMTSLLPGNEAGPLLGLYIHDLVGLWVTPMGWGMMYFFVPVILKRPIWSHSLSLVGFWGLAFFYPLQGVHHFLGSPIPMFAQYSAVISTIAIEIVVTSVVINFFMTWMSDPGSIKKSLPIRWFWIGAFNYFLTCTQCAFQVTLSFQQFIHFTDWVVAHAHLVMFGVFSFWIFGMIQHLWPKLTGKDWWSHEIAVWQFWLAVIGLEGMFLTLTGGGLIEGFMSMSMAHRADILESMWPFWAARVVLGGMIILSFLMLIFNMYMTAKFGKKHVEDDYQGCESLVSA